MNANLNLSQSFIVLIMKDWNDWGDVVNSTYQWKHTLFGMNRGHKGQAITITLTPTMTPKHVVVIILEPVYKSCLSPSIQYTYNKRFGGLSCCEILA